MKKPDYKLKSKILTENTLLEDYKKCSKSIYHYVYGLECGTDLPYDLAKKISFENSRDFPEEWKECYRISHARCKRVINLRKRVTDMVLNSNCIFLTFTFTNESLSRLSERSRRQYVKEFLSSLRVPYVANVDFGKRNHREHYHALVGIDNVNYKMWKYGALNGQRIRNNTEDLERLSRYIAKLTNHAIKETTKRSVIMFSRKKYVCVDRRFLEIDKNNGELKI